MHTDTAEAPVVDTLVAKEKKVSITAYKVVSLPAIRERLSPQLRALVAAIDECKKDVDGSMQVLRSEIFAAWEKAVGSESGDKVFASYMHQLLSFSFLDRVGGTTGTPKKVISPLERKEKLMAMVAKLPEADRLELLKSLGVV